MENIECRLCGYVARVAMNIVLRRRFEAAFYLCEHCGLLQSEKPYWLEEAYSRAISRMDTGILRRNLTFMRVVAVLFALLGRRKGVFLDYGGGHGVFTRLMRDHGYDFRWLDRYAENLYADGFEYEDGVGLEGVTAFEVLEHLEDPAAGMDELFARFNPGFLLISTELFDEPVDPGWEYIYPDNGQHIAFYQAKTMRYIAERYGYHWTNWRFLHLFSKKPIPAMLARFLIPFSWLVFPLVAPFLRAGSLHADDCEKLSGGGK